MGNLLVAKFGGKALQDCAHLERASRIICERKKHFSRIIIVVSAMGEMTDHLMNLARSIHLDPPKREQDMLVSVGERISMSLLAISLSKQNLDSVSFTGSQAGIITTPEHANAEIVQIRPYRVEKALQADKIAIVAGFQGVSQDGEITTLGRGGSDTSAVALAATLSADRVEFYKDVPGLYLQNPKKNPQAEHVQKASYDLAMQILEKEDRALIHAKALKFAKKYHIPLVIRSFEERETKETHIVGECCYEQANSM